MIPNHCVLADQCAVKNHSTSFIYLLKIIFPCQSMQAGNAEQSNISSLGDIRLLNLPKKAVEEDHNVKASLQRQINTN